ncbi:motility protein A [Desulfonatronovibrio magnus]|uniref:motility protein A n=1 Tax=Desulfonatronovibrio magnus TaxID=698827 RepID=UPI0005EB9748|nr:MotA/TolQ/ExbB proton channel family protein [Desulfonatronovibrio magnus]
MDIATFFGIIVGFSLVIGAIIIGGAVDTFVNIPGMMIVMGGTMAATTINFPVNQINKAFRAAFYIFSKRSVNSNDVVNTMVRIADISRRDGLLALENIKTENAVLKKACQLIADNTDPMMIAETLRIEITSLRNRHAIIQDVFKKMATFSPSFGMIGTLIGLVQMLTRLDDPATIGPAMAVAILTTFYGALLATLLFLPIAGKLKSRTQQETLHLEIIFQGAQSILENNNPRIVYEKLSSFVPPSERRNERR